MMEGGLYPLPTYCISQGCLVAAGTIDLVEGTGLHLATRQNTIDE
jgi:hypothetical protein